MLPPLAPLPDTPPRRGFALRGPSVALDTRTHAIRADLADVRLAESVFAPHYTWPLTRSIARETTLRAERDPVSDALATLSSGDTFEVLEFARGLAWGVAPAIGLVGYVRADALASAT